MFSPEASLADYKDSKNGEPSSIFRKSKEDAYTNGHLYLKRNVKIVENNSK